MTRWAAHAPLLLALTLSACGGFLPSKLSPSEAQIRGLQGDRCVVAATHREPLVTEWTASSKARLEILLTATLADIDKYAVAVEYSGCELRIIDGCQPVGAYDWLKSTLSRDTVDIHDTDDLYAKLPLGAAKLEGALTRSGRLSIQTTVAGQIRLKRASVDFEAVAGDDACAEATHIVESVSIGAFRMVEGGRLHASVGGSAMGIARAGAATSRAERLMREAGSDAECQRTNEDKPHLGCRSPLQLFLLPIPNRTAKVNLSQTPTLSDARGHKPDQPSTMRTLSYIFGGLGVAGLAGGGASLGVSGGIEDKLRNSPYGTFATPDDITNAQSSMATTRTLGSAGVISGGLLLGIALPLFILGGK
jgi:hypothetical protein